MTHALDLAWAAGLFVGEGCVRNEGGARTGVALCMSINMYDEEALKRFVTAVKPYTDAADREYFGPGRPLPLSVRKGRMKRKTKAQPEEHYVEVFYIRTRHHKSLAIGRALYPYMVGTLKGEEMKKAFKIAGEDLNAG